MSQIQKKTTKQTAEQKRIAELEEQLRQAQRLQEEKANAEEDADTQQDEQDEDMDSGEEVEIEQPEEQPVEQKKKPKSSLQAVRSPAKQVVKAKVEEQVKEAKDEVIDQKAINIATGEFIEKYLEQEHAARLHYKDLINFNRENFQRAYKKWTDDTFGKPSVSSLMKQMKGLSIDDEDEEDAPARKITGVIQDGTNIYDTIIMPRHREKQVSKKTQGMSPVKDDYDFSLIAHLTPFKKVKQAEEEAKAKAKAKTKAKKSIVFEKEEQ